MALLSDDMIRITNEEINGQDPAIADDEEAKRFRRKIKKQIKWIRQQGWTPEAPFEFPDPQP